MAIEHMKEFLDHLRVDAEERRDDAGYSGSFSDGGYSTTMNLICAYRSGQEGKIPAFWVDKYNAFLNTKDAEYETYVRLKEKFEGK